MNCSNQARRVREEMQGINTGRMEQQTWVEDWENIYFS